MSENETMEVTPTDDEAEEETLAIVSVLGGSKRVGRWRIPSSTSVIAVFGRTTLDLRQVESQAEQIEIRCLSVFAGVTILVPKGADVRPAGTAILASTSCHIPATDEPSALPPVIITATTVLGTLHIQTEARPVRARRRKGRKQPEEPTWSARQPALERPRPALVEPTLVEPALVEPALVEATPVAPVLVVSVEPTPFVPFEQEATVPDAAPDELPVTAAP